jgi:GNAT superfamily N-acetyltransferase
MSEAIRIRKPRWSDVPGIFRVANQAFLEGARYPISVLDRLENPWNYLAVCGSETVGFLFGQENPEESEVAIGLLAVHPGYQGMGVGTRLIRTFERNARKAGHSTISTGTPFALEFYRKLGFRITKTDYALTKELVGVAVTLPTDNFVDQLVFSDLDEIIATFNTRDRSAFLKRFFEVHRQGSSHMFIARAQEPDRAGKVIGAIVGSINERYSDLLEVVFLSGTDATKLALLGNMAYRASTEGVRWLGTRSNNSRLVHALQKAGYEVAHLPEFWTLFGLGKALG